MKILVVSLLRLGDVILAASVVKSLRQENRHAEIHLLMNEQFASVAELIPAVDRVHYFRRQLLQEILGDPERNMLEAFYRVEELVGDLQLQRFDRVINLTHNKLSAWLTTQIGVRDTLGAHFDDSGVFQTGSRWFRHLNETAELKDTVRPSFHFIDVFHMGAGLRNNNHRIQLRESRTAHERTLTFLNKISAPTRIVLQISSHEKKKTLAPDQWREVLQLLSQVQPEADIIVLAAPNEVAEVEKTIAQTRARLFECTLAEAFSCLLQSHLLITTDTSIKHLAAAAPIRVLELSLGSSDFERTGVYTHGHGLALGNGRLGICYQLLARAASRRHAGSQERIHAAAPAAA
jgi:ADP-heptose:LPS heptosyltransferase